MYSVAEEVHLLAEKHGIITRGDCASYLANEVNRIEGIPSDATLELIGGLMESGTLTDEQGVALVLRHHREVSAQSAAVVVFKR